MAFQLPGVFDTSAPQSVEPSTATVDFSGVQATLDHVGQALDMHDEVQNRIADQRAARIEADAMAKYDPERAQRAQAYTGEAPGYAQSEISNYDAAVAEYRQMALPPREQRALNLRLDQRRLKVSDDAIAWEAVKRGGLEGQRRAAQESAADSQVLTQLAPLADQAVRGVHDAWDGKTPGYATGVGDAFDKAASSVMDNLPEIQRLRLQPQIQAQRNAYFAGAMSAEDQGVEANQVHTANDAANAAVNMVLGNADSFQAAGFLTDHAAMALPVPLQDAYRKAARQKLILARFDNMLDAGKVEDVKNELPTFQAQLEPADYARVQDGIKRAGERLQAADYAGQAAMQSRLSAYLDGIMAGDDRAKQRPSDAEVAGALGEKGLAEFRQKEAVYTTAKAQIGDFSSLSAAQIDQRISALQDKAKQGGADYTTNAEVLDAALRAKDAQVKARSDDPANWAMASDGSASDPGAWARLFWQTAQTETDPAKQAYTLRSYGDATLARQRDAGIPNPQLLPGNYAKALVKSVADAPPEQKGQAFQSLINSVSVWGDRRGMVIGELRKAGLGGPEAVVAAEFSKDPVAQQAFMQGGAFMQGMKPKDRDHLTDQVRQSLGKFDATAIGPASSQQLRDDRYGAIARIAAGYMASGDNAGHAVQKATSDYRDTYAFAGTWRMPKALADAQVPGYNFTDVVADKMYSTNLPAVQRATLAIKNGLSGSAGADINLGTTRPGEGMSRLSDNQAEARNMARTIAATGRWVTLPDDSGLALMVPDPVAGTWAVVRDKGGQPISYSFGDLVTAGNYAKGQNYTDERLAGIHPRVLTDDNTGPIAPVVRPAKGRVQPTPVATVEKVVSTKVAGSHGKAGAPSTVFPAKGR